MRLLASACMAVLMAATTACTSSAEACADAARELRVGLQAYVDGFKDVTPEAFATSENAGDVTSLARTVAEYRQEVRIKRCDREDLRRTVTGELESVRGSGVIGESIAATLRAAFTRSSAFGGAELKPETRALKPGDDIAGAVAGVLPGSTLQLAEGVYRVSEPIIVVEDTTLLGAGRDKTRIVSTAPGAAVMFLGAGRLNVRSLSIEHEGSSPANVVVIRAGSYSIRDVRLTGARRAKDGSSGVGLIAGVGRPTSDPSERTMQIENSEFVRNDISGIAIGSSDAPTITNVVVRGSSGCGVCYIGEAGGTLRSSRIESNATGVTVLSRARPLVDRNTLRANRIGIQVRDTAQPTIARNTITRGRDAAIVFTGSSRGSARDNRCTQTPLGIVLLESAKPSLGRNSCAVFGRR